jgi:hypothetical protein
MPAQVLLDAGQRRMSLSASPEVVDECAGPNYRPAEPMTVCLAALCHDNDEARAVIAADRMVTLGGFIEFEHAVPKMTSASSLAIAMVAGETLSGTRLAQEVADSLAGNNPPIAEIAQRLAAHYEVTRRARLEQALLTPRGLDLGSFYESHAVLNANIVALIDNQMTQYNLGVELLLAGVDPSGAHIYSIGNPGPPENLHDTIGYAAVGSGWIHAIQALIGFGHAASADYHETVFRAYAAKRRAEVTPGVGLDTDMAVISAAGIHWLTDDELGQLREMYEEFETSTSSALRERLESFRLGEGTEDEKTGDTDN